MSAPPRPLALLAEVTYRCPLHCPYCSNPVLPQGREELSTAEWERVFREAAALGVLQAGLSGGEPMARADLAELIRSARQAGLYTNVLTSGLGLSEERLVRLQEAGLDSLQLSMQADEALLADCIAGTAAHARKLKVARMVRAQGLSLSLNVVLHQANLDRLGSIIALAEELGAERLELANTQYYGWAFANREQLLPTREQVLRARAVASTAQQRLAGRLEIFYVLPDLYEDRPKPCLQGLGATLPHRKPVWRRAPLPDRFIHPGAHL